MKTFIITIELPDDCSEQGVKETLEENIGELIEDEGGCIVSVKEKK